ncbi:MAG: plasmid replication/partition related protein [Acidovorax sp. SCN 65-28]|uniref:plasmid replication/partition related protein n=1 Tax=Acidovorax sp. TaxID=1872122 RepID=UPI00086B6498|nr:plasmid replication/partition related protein [Acidovorax sp.]MBN9628051.1 plasmid replication/partition related protein [Acidovorax sp.]ODS79611.1 MAG: plasmid replication/partition related protein [Acidovorax sp. SCN 65-28]
MNIVVNEELKAYIEPLTPDEHDALERSILTEGCRDALVLWGDVLVDGHNRYGICQKHGLPFQTVQNPRFQSMEDVHLWMIDQHLGRRSVSDFQRGVLALRKREIMAERKARAATATETTEATPAADVPEAAAALPAPDPLNSREAIAKAARLSSSQVVMIEKIQKQAAPELVAAVKSGTISINAAAAVATLPAEEQVAAAVAGKDELKQAAKRVRELSKRKPREEAPSEDKAHAEPASSAEGNTDELHALRLRVAELTAENTELRRQVAQLQAALPADSAPF